MRSDCSQDRVHGAIPFRALTAALAELHNPRPTGCRDHVQTNIRAASDEQPFNVIDLGGLHQVRIERSREL